MKKALFSLKAQTGEVAAKGEMPIEGGVLDFGSVHGVACTC